MTLFLTILSWWLVFISAVSAVLTVYDKFAAPREYTRVPEKLLFSLAALGGSAAMYLTMRLIRHKTRHRSFMWGIPAIFLAQCALAFLVWRLAL